MDPTPGRTSAAPPATIEAKCARTTCRFRAPDCPHKSKSTEQLRGQRQPERDSSGSQRGAVARVHLKSHQIPIEREHQNNRNQEPAEIEEHDHQPLQPSRSTGPDRPDASGSTMPASESTSPGPPTRSLKTITTASGAANPASKPKQLRAQASARSREPEQRERREPQSWPPRRSFLRFWSRRRTRPSIPPATVKRRSSGCRSCRQSSASVARM